MDFFKRLFSRKAHEPAPPDWASMDLSQVENVARGLGDGTQLGTLVSCYERLYEIAMFEHHIPMEDHERALHLSEALAHDIENHLADDPEGWAAFNEAIEYHADKVQFYGVGSLQWITKEYGISNAELVSFVVQKQWAELLPTYLTMLDDETIGTVRLGFIRDLIPARRDRPEMTDLQVLRALDDASDRSLELLLTAGELRTLRAAETDRDAAEELVLRLMND